MKLDQTLKMCGLRENQESETQKIIGLQIKIETSWLSAGRDY